MGSSLIQLLVLAGVAVFLILKLRSVLGTRDGFEKPPIPLDDLRPRSSGPVLVENGPDRDIIDHVTEGSKEAENLAAMKGVEAGFSVGTFLQGARGAYEMIVTAFDKGELASIKPFLNADVLDSFSEAVAAREAQGLTIQSTFVGIREVAIDQVEFDRTTKWAEVSVRFVAELTTVVRDKAGVVVEGSSSEIKRQRDVWTFARTMGSSDPNWQLVATGD
ncbi:Tim44/TimA family putative adaptor protein [Neogemmobacter tilapiae]|uniref:Preprotein translocase subunit Tim44 n=1 Tax=Neogemmobacter tilapiae TaxID=875041 RepID=A0A918WKQ4_9RHOB|nr:Tim44/TimA family putative adaptor protein [Gemmobacter tilapiae]GHC51776.1 preprotein translocase subunit Tim44 [Gemmobacter tilapiae]